MMKQLLWIFYVIQDHSRFVNCVRYAPNGDFFVSGGAEGKVRVACTAVIITT